MARKNIIFQGVDRPAEWLGLPVLYVILGAGVWLAELLLFGFPASMILTAALYIGLRLFYEWEPRFFRILFIARFQTPATKNRKHNHGDLYIG